jgi:WD40 repeat protein/serine/threonine protein kinase
LAKAGVQATLPGNAPASGPGPGLPAIPGYDILEELGRGGMGVVYKARQVGLNRIAALKMILGGSQSGPEQVARFLAEAEAVAQLQHPNIVQIYEVGRHGEQPYFALEYVSGGGLDKKLNGTPLPPMLAAGLVEAAARGIHAAHERGIIHRDLKPGNILLQRESSTKDTKGHEEHTKNPLCLATGGSSAGLDSSSCPFVSFVDESWIPKITDFGLAKRVDTGGGLTQTGAILGTPSYMSPEQARSGKEPVGRPTDVYALGAILYELLTGRPPFRAASPLDTIMLVVSEEPVPPSRLTPKLPRDLETICLRCLAKEPRKRYASANDLAEDLSRFLSGQPVHARPVGRVERSWRWCRRNPVLACLTGAVVGLLVALSVGSTIAALFLGEAADTERVLRAESDRAARTERDLRSDSDRARKEVQIKADESRQRLVRLNVRTGTAYLDRDDWLTAQIWFAEALSQDRGDPAREEVHRLRLGVLRRLCPRLVRAWPHEKPVRSADISPDGRLILAVCGAPGNGWNVGDGEVHLWDVATGKPAVPEARQLGPVQHAVFSPDGKHFVTACGAPGPNKQAEARIWDTATGAPVGKVLRHSHDIHYAAYSRDGMRIVTASGTSFNKPAGEVGIWDASGNAIALLPHRADVNQAAFSSAGLRVVTASSNGQAQVWDIARRETVTPPLTHNGPVNQAWFSPDNQRILTASQDGTARIWNRAGQLIATLKHRGPVGCAAFRHNGTLVVTASQDGTAQVWDASTGRPITPPLQHNGPVTHVAFSADGRRVVTATGEDLSDDGEARVWDAHTGRPLTPWLKHTGRVAQALFSRDGVHVVTAAADKMLRLWDVSQGGPTFVPQKISGMAKLAVSSDGRRVAVHELLNTVRVVDATLGKPVMQPLVHPHPVTAASFNRAGDRVWTICRDQKTGVLEGRIWEVATGRAVAPVFSFANPGQMPPQLAFSTDGRYLAWVTYTGPKPRLQLWSTATGKPLPFQPWTDGAFRMFSPDDRFLVTVHRDTKGKETVARVWETATGKAATLPLHHDHEVAQASFSTDQGRLATASNTFQIGGDALGVGEARVWRLAEGAQVGPPLLHRGAVNWVAVSPDPQGSRVVTASRDKTARVWQATGEPLTPLLRHPGPVLKAFFHPRGHSVLTISGDAVRLWEVATGDPITPFLRHPWPVHEAAFSADGSSLIVHGALPGQVRLVDLRPDERPAADLARLASVMAGSEVDAVGGLAPLSAATIARRLQAMQAKYPGESRWK